MKTEEALKEVMATVLGITADSISDQVTVLLSGPNGVGASTSAILGG